METEGILNQWIRKVLGILYHVLCAPLLLKTNVAQSLDCWLSLHQKVHPRGPTLDLWNQSLENKTHKSSFKQGMWGERQCWNLRTILFHCILFACGAMSYLSLFYSQFIAKSLGHSRHSNFCKRKKWIVFSWNS